MKMMPRPMNMDLGMFFSGSMVSSAIGQTNSMPMQSQMARAMSEKTSMPMGLKGISGIWSAGAPSSMRPTAPSALMDRIMMAVKTTCDLAKMSTPSTLKNTRITSSTMEKTIGGIEGAKTLLKTKPETASSAGPARRLMTT